MGFISGDARGEERREEVKKQWGDSEIGKKKSRERKIESGESERERARGPKGDRVIGMFSHVCPLERHQSSLSLLDFFISRCFSPCNNPLPSSR